MMKRDGSRSDRQISPQLKSSILKIVYCLVAVLAIVGIIVAFLLINKAVAKKAFQKKKKDAEKELKEYLEWMETNRRDYDHLMAITQPTIEGTIPSFSQPMPQPQQTEPTKQTEPPKPAEKETRKPSTDRPLSTKTRSHTKISEKNTSKTKPTQSTEDRQKTTKEPTKKEENKKKAPPRSELYEKMKQTKKTKPSMLKMNVGQDSDRESVITLMELEQWIEPQALDELKKMEMKDDNFRSFMESIKKAHKKPDTTKLKETASTVTEDFIKFYMGKDPNFAEYLINVGAIERDENDQHFWFSEDESSLLSRYREFLSGNTVSPDPIENIQITPSPTKQEEEQEEDEVIEAKPFDPSSLGLSQGSIAIPQGFVRILDGGSQGPNVQVQGISFLQVPLNVQQIPIQPMSFQDLVREITGNTENESTSQEGRTPSRIESLEEEDVPSIVGTDRSSVPISITDYLNQQRKNMNSESIETASPKDTFDQTFPSKTSSQETVQLTLEKTESVVDTGLESVD